MKRFALMAAVCLFAVSCANRLDLPVPPLGTGNAEEAPAVPVSEVVVPLRVDKADIESRFAAMLPEEFSGRVGLTNDQNTVLEWHVVRERPRLMGTGRVMRVEIPLTVGVAVRRDILGKQYRAGCTGDKRLKTTLRIDFPLEWTDDWKLTAAPSLRPLRMGGCEVPVVSYMLEGDRVADTLHRYITRTMGELEPVTVVDAGSSMGALWRSLTRPVRLDGVGTLRLHPLQVFASPIEDDGETLTSSVGVRFRPEVLVGGVAGEDDDEAELPPVVFDRAETGVRLALMVRLPFDLAGRLLSERLGGTVVAPGTTVQSVMVDAIPGRVRIGVRITGTFKGTIYFVGNPVVSGSDIRFTDIESTWRPENLPGLLAGLLMQGDLLAKVREAAVFSAVADEKALTEIFGITVPGGAAGREIRVRVSNSGIGSFRVLPDGFAAIATYDASFADAGE